MILKYSMGKTCNIIFKYLNNLFSAGNIEDEQLECLKEGLLCCDPKVQLG